MQRESDEPIEAGPLGPWLATIVRVLRGEAEADVPCGDCVACCSSRQFVHVAPDEIDALALIPSELTAPAPGLPAGHVVVGFDRDGRCPMLGASGCTIYDHRPRTCRAYDCRVFTATGIDPDPDQPAIAARVRRWRFQVEAPDDVAAQRSMRLVAAALDDREAYPDGHVPRASQRAAIAIGLRELGTGDTRPSPAAVRIELSRRRG